MLKAKVAITLSTIFILGLTSNAIAQDASTPCRVINKQNKRIKKIEKKLNKISKLLQSKPKKHLPRVKLLLQEVKLDLAKIELEQQKMLLVCGKGGELNTKININDSHTSATVSGGGAHIKIEINDKTSGNVRIDQEDTQGPGMPASSFEKLISQLKEASFADDKLNIISTAAHNNFFTASQVKRILGTFSFSEGKLKALRLLKHRIVDRNNLFIIYSAFTFSSDKEKAKEILEH